MFSILSSPSPSWHPLTSAGDCNYVTPCFPSRDTWLRKFATSFWFFFHFFLLLLRRHRRRPAVKRFDIPPKGSWKLPRSSLQCANDLIVAAVSYQVDWNLMRRDLFCWISSRCGLTRYIEYKHSIMQPIYIRLETKSCRISYGKFMVKYDRT